MSASPNLMYATLAMDAYNRGYNPSILDFAKGSDRSVQIGTTARVSFNLENPQFWNEAIAAGFYAGGEWVGESKHQ